jgi:C-terminal processing protease CtpA/Prc
MISSLQAQDPRITRVGPRTVMTPSGGFFMNSNDEPHAVIGVSTSNAATNRDTLGVLVSIVRSGSPAEKAGIEEGNRIAAINGVSLKLAAADVGDDQMAGVLSRRLSRELDKLKPRDEVDLRLYANGQNKTVKVKTIAPADLYETRVSRSADDRATLGVNLAVTGSARDSLGVFVLSVADGGPAAKAGIEEGTRIASINGVDVRGHHSSDDDDFLFRASNVNRLEREVSRLHPGDDVDLRVYFNGQTRNVKFKAGRMSDLPRRNRSVTIMGGDNVMVPEILSRIDGPRIASDVRRTVEASMEGMSRMLWRVGGRQDW